ncbi:retroviral-like aspartic protease, partial [Labilibacter sediminis]
MKREEFEKIVADSEKRIIKEMKKYSRIQAAAVSNIEDVMKKALREIQEQLLNEKSIQLQEKEAEANVVTTSIVDAGFLEKETRRFEPYTSPALKKDGEQSNSEEAKEEDLYNKLTSKVKVLKVNVPVVNGANNISKYATFMKDLFTNEDKVKNVLLRESCSSILTNTLPKKMRDPGSLTVPCKFGNNIQGLALADSGASVNLMPYSFYKKLELPEPKPVSMVINLANKSSTLPRGVVEDLLVKLDKFVFPADFIILDMKEDGEVPIILGRPFLSTARALVDIHDTKLTVRVGDEEVVFGVDQAIKHPRFNDDRQFNIDAFDEIVKDEWSKEQVSEIEGRSILVEMERDPEQKEEEVEELVEYSKKQDENFEDQNEDLEPTRRVDEARIAPETEPDSKLKPLPDHLEYAFLEEGSKIPVIISADLEKKEKK